MYNWEQDVTLNIGQEQWLRARNQTGTLITNGTVVRLVGAIGDRPTVEPAISSDQTNLFSVDNEIIGMATHDIENGTDGFITTFGLVNGIDTSAFNVGDLLWVSQSAGQFTSTPPPPPFDKTFVGIVTRKNANNGTVFMTPLTSIHFHDISSVSASVYQMGDLWMYRSGSVGQANAWINTKALTGSYSISGSLTTTSFTGSLFGTASYATVANSVNDLNQNVYVSGSLTVVGNSTFIGTASFVNVTASNIFVSESFISVNVFEPAERFGGLKVYDSGSSTATASLAWDSFHNHWVYQNVDGAIYTGGMLLAGPRNTGSLGDEPNLTKWRVPRSDGGDHLDDSQIYSSGSTTIITGSLTVTSGITGSLEGTATTASYVLNAVSSSFATQALSASFATSASWAPDTTFPYTGSALITGSLAVTGSLTVLNANSLTPVFDTNGSIIYSQNTSESIKWDSRQLYTSAGIVSIDWDLRKAASSTAVAIDWENLYLHDPYGNVVIAWGSTTLYDYLGNVAINWDQRSAYNTSSQLTLDWKNLQVYDNTGATSIDWNYRQLIKSDATTVVFDWENGALTSSLYGTASWAENTISSSFSDTASFATQALSASFAISASFAPTPPSVGSFGITIDGAGSTITTGNKGHVVIPYNGTITGWTIVADQSGSCVIDVWRANNLIPTSSNTIAGTEKPTLSNQQLNSDTNLTTWTSSISTGDIIAFNVDSATTVTRVNLSISVIKQ